MANAEKAAAVAQIADSFRSASAAVLTEYRGLSVSDIKKLRGALGTGTKYAVVKNTLTKIAANEAGVEGLDDMLAGPTAIAFVTGDPVEAAKGLRAFAREHPLLVIKGGVLDGRPLSPAEITQLADLESREVLLAKLAGALQGSLSQAVRLFAAPLTQVARMTAALETKATEDPSILRGGAGAGTPVESSTADEAAPSAQDGANADTASHDTTPADLTPAEFTQVAAATEAPQPAASADVATTAETSAE